MRVADVVSKLRLLAAHCTHLSHYLLQERLELEVQTLDFTGFEPFSPSSQLNSPSLDAPRFVRG
jgi:hypothetical protein